MQNEQCNNQNSVFTMTFNVLCTGIRCINEIMNWRTSFNLLNIINMQQFCVYMVFSCFM